MSSRPKSEEHYKNLLYTVRKKRYGYENRNGYNAARLSPAQKSAITRAARRLSGIAAGSKIWHPPRRPGETPESHEKRIRKIAKANGRPGLRGVIIEDWSTTKSIRLDKDGRVRVQRDAWTEYIFPPPEDSAELIRQIAKAAKMGASSVAFIISGANRTSSFPIEEALEFLENYFQGEEDEDAAEELMQELLGDKAYGKKPKGLQLLAYLPESGAEKLRAADELGEEPEEEPEELPDFLDYRAPKNATRKPAKATKSTKATKSRTKSRKPAKANRKRKK